MSTFHEESGKGDFRRPSEVSAEKYRSNWDAIFSKPTAKEECPTCKDKGGCFDAGWYYECTSCGK